MIDRVQDLPTAPNDTQDRDGYIAWWWLAGATVFQGDRAIITFGQGRSSHTWRDFRATMHLLGRFARRPVTLNFSMHDEGFPGAQPVTETITPVSA